MILVAARNREHDALARADREGALDRARHDAGPRRRPARHGVQDPLPSIFVPKSACDKSSFEGEIVTLTRQRSGFPRRATS